MNENIEESHSVARISKKYYWYFSPTIVLIFLTTNLFAADKLIVNGDEISLDSLAGNDDQFVYISRYENSRISGELTLSLNEAGPLVFTENAAGEQMACCERVFIQADRDIFRPSPLEPGKSLHTAFIRLIQPDTVLEGSYQAYSFESPSVHLPVDGMPVEISFFQGQSKLRTIRIRLAKDIIVLPVHVHVLVNSQRSFIAKQINANNVYRWFEQPLLLMSANSAQNEHTAARETTIKQDRVYDRVSYLNADEVWQQAGIQFRLQTYELIQSPRHDELEHQILGGDREALNIAALHRERMHIPGIHIYVGRNATGIRDASGVSSMPNCTMMSSESLKPTNAVALAWTMKSSIARNSLVLAHEIGHFLGLDHTAENSPCGRDLVGDSESINLMNGLSGVIVTEKQIKFARKMACLYTQQWGLKSPACALEPQERDR